jgi:putative peptidoglycan lipid II flippase
MRAVLLIGLPASIALIVLAEPILVTLFQYGALTALDVEMATLSLRAYSLGLMAFMLVKVLAPGFYARQDMVTPVRIGIMAMAANMIMNLAFVVPLYLYWNIGHVGLALATSLAAYLNAGLLLQGLRRKGLLELQPGWKQFLLRLLIASAAMGSVILLLAPESALWLEWDWWQRSLQLGLLVLAGLFTYLLSQLMMGTRIRDFYTQKHP